jgi:hypothetical protein
MPSSVTNQRLMAVGSAFTMVFQSVVVEKQQTCKVSVLCSLLDADWPNRETPLKREGPSNLHSVRYISLCVIMRGEATGTSSR